MRTDGFEADIPREIADETHMRLIKVPDYYDPDQQTELQNMWDKLTEKMPNLVQEIKRLSYEISPKDKPLRDRIRIGFLSLYVVLGDAKTSSNLEEDFYKD